MLSAPSIHRLTRRLACGSAFLLFACSTAPSADETESRVPAERRFEPALLRPSHRRNCELTIIREKGASARGLNIFLDGARIARMAAGESLTVYVKPGHHYVGVKPLFSPSTGRVCVLGKGESAGLRILDRNGNYELIAAEGAWLDSIGRSVRSLGQ